MPNSSVCIVLMCTMTCSSLYLTCRYNLGLRTRCKAVVPRIASRVPLYPSSLHLLSSKRCAGASALPCSFGSLLIALCCDCFVANATHLRDFNTLIWRHSRAEFSVPADRCISLQGLGQTTSVGVPKSLAHDASRHAQALWPSVSPEYNGSWIILDASVVAFRLVFWDRFHNAKRRLGSEVVRAE